jgi:hypothetical protein
VTCSVEQSTTTSSSRIILRTALMRGASAFERKQGDARYENSGTRRVGTCHNNKNLGNSSILEFKYLAIRRGRY